MENFLKKKRYSSFKGRFIVLECKKKVNQDTYYGTWRGIVLREVNKKIDDIFYCMMFNDNAKKFYRPGDVVLADLTSNNYTPNGDPGFSDFLINNIKFVNKLSWMKVR